MHISSIPGSISLVEFNQISQSDNRVLVPVRPSQMVLTQYQYIAGTPAAHGQRTVPLPRIHLLNSLINNLKNRSKEESLASQSQLSQNQTDVLIEQYAAELHQVMKAEPEIFGTLSGSVDAGILFQVSA